MEDVQTSDESADNPRIWGARLSAFSIEDLGTKEPGGSTTEFLSLLDPLLYAMHGSEQLGQSQHIALEFHCDTNKADFHLCKAV